MQEAPKLDPLTASFCLLFRFSITCHNALGDIWLLKSSTFLCLICDLYDISCSPFPGPTCPSQPSQPLFIIWRSTTCQSLFFIWRLPMCTCISSTPCTLADLLKVKSVSHISNLPQYDALNILYHFAMSGTCRHRCRGRTRFPQMYVFLNTAITEDDLQIMNLRLVYTNRGVDICYHMQSWHPSSTCPSLCIPFCCLSQLWSKPLIAKNYLNMVS